MLKVFDLPSELKITRIDNRYNYGELREITIGAIDPNTFVIVHTERRDRTRIISARKANKKEVKVLQKWIENNARD